MEAAGYYDIVPDTRVFFPPERPSRAPASKVETVQKKKGLYSFDPLLDHNTDELWRFLVSNLSRPKLTIRVHGTHTRSTGSSSTTTVTDFKFDIDASQYVVPQWARLYTRPPTKQGTAPTVKETLEEYTGSKNSFKEIRLMKVLDWDFDALKKAIKDVVRSTGYRSSVKVTFPMQDYKVVAAASNEYSKAAQDKAVRVLCCVSLLCLVFWPVWALARKHMKDRLVVEFAMAASAQEFFSRNNARIHWAVSQRRKKEVYPAL